MPKVSIIVPIYNAGPHLTQCLNALTNQTLQDIEIILVLDCPTDGSEKIAASFAVKHSNIKLIYNQINNHIGFSRNIGIEAATGEYIGFSDHDDFCLPNMFEELYLVAQKYQADVVLSNVKTLKTLHEQHTSSDSRIVCDDKLSVRQCFSDLLSASQKLATGLIYTQLYRKQFLDNHQIRFTDTRYCSSEDQLFNIQVYHSLLKQQGKLIYLHKTYYYHLLHQTNTGGTIAYRELRKNITLLNNIHSVINSNTCMPQAEQNQLFAYRIIKNLYTSWRYELRYKGIQAFRNLKQIDKPLQSIIKQHYKIYDPQLSICKNGFNLLLRVFYI